MKLAILGFGREGQSILKFLRRERIKSKSEIWILDKNPSLKTPRGTRAQLGPGYLKNISRFDIIYRSPGIPYTLPALIRARCDGTKLSSATELFFEELKNVVRRGSPQVIGITGSKGKSTTATLLYNILKIAHRDTYLAGNVGKPALDILPLLRQGYEGQARLKKNSWVVLELSSFQLHDLVMSPHTAVVLDAFPEHQDAHGSLREYYGAKANIAQWQKPNDAVFFFADNATSKNIAMKGGGNKMPVSPSAASDLADTVRAALKLPGEHQFRNALMAATVAAHLGIPHAATLKAIRSFRGLPHRLQLVRRIGNVEFYDDSASTNPQSAAAAVRTFGVKSHTLSPKPYPLVLIAGGSDKGLDYAPLAEALRKNRKNVSLVVLYGENRKKIAAAIKKSGVPTKIVGTLTDATRIAYKTAITLSPKPYPLNPIVLLSPASTSFDQFKNYADRGERFQSLVRGLK